MTSMDTGKSMTVFISAWRPASLNSLMSGKLRDRMRLKKSDREIIQWAFRGMPKATGKRRVSMEITMGKGMREYDFDNSWKSLLDGLVKAGMLVDDRNAYCQLGTITHIRDSSKWNEWGTTVILEDVA